MMDVKNRFFNIPLGDEVGDYFLLQLARGLAGELMKKIMFGLGSSNNGKSTLVEVCQLSFGEYVGNFNAETLAFREIKTDQLALGFTTAIKIIKKIVGGVDRVTACLHCVVTAVSMFYVQHWYFTWIDNRPLLKRCSTFLLSVETSFEANL